MYIYMRKKNLYTKYVRCTRDCAMQVHETVQDRFTRKGSHDRASVHRLKKKKKEKKMDQREETSFLVYLVNVFIDLCGQR